MPATLAPRPSARPNRKGVRRLPNPPFRPTDLKILGFEGAFEGLVCEQDDARAMVAGLAIVQHVGSIQAMTERRIAATNKLSAHDGIVLRDCRDELSRVVEHLRMRAERLRDAAIPEERRIATIFDHELAAREKGRVSNMPRVQDYYQALEMEDGSRYEVGGTYCGAEIISIYAPPGGPTVIATPAWNYTIPLADIRYWCQEA